MFKTVQFLSLSLLFLLLILGCATPPSTNELTAKQNTSNIDHKSYQDFYYPVADLNETRVYHYQMENDTNQHLIWVLSAVREDNKLFLITDSYTMDSSGIITLIEFIKEEINEIGSKVIQYIEYQTGEDGNKIKLSAENGNEWVYKWDLKPNDPIIWDFKLNSDVIPDYERTTRKFRSYSGQDTTIQFNGKDYRAIKFSDQYSIEYKNNSQVVNFTQTSWYAEGIGMYRYERHLPNQTITYSLSEILSMEQWNQLIK